MIELHVQFHNVYCKITSMIELLSVCILRFAVVDAICFCRLWTPALGAVANKQAVEYLDFPAAINPSIEIINSTLLMD